MFSEFVRKKIMIIKKTLLSGRCGPLIPVRIKNSYFGYHLRGETKNHNKAGVDASNNIKGRNYTAKLTEFSCNKPNTYAHNNLTIGKRDQTMNLKANACKQTPPKVVSAKVCHEPPSLSRSITTTTLKMNMVIVTIK